MKPQIMGQACGSPTLMVSTALACVQGPVVTLWFVLQYYSWSQACWWYPPGRSHTVCAVQERLQTVTTDTLQPLPQDQCQTGGHQQHPGTKCQVGCVPHSPDTGLCIVHLRQTVNMTHGSEHKCTKYPYPCNLNRTQVTHTCQLNVTLDMQDTRACLQSVCLKSSQYTVIYHVCITALVYLDYTMSPWTYTNESSALLHHLLCQLTFRRSLCRLSSTCISSFARYTHFKFNTVASYLPCRVAQCPLCVSFACVQVVPRAFTRPCSWCLMPASCVVVLSPQVT